MYDYVTFTYPNPNDASYNVSFTFRPQTKVYISTIKNMTANTANISSSFRIDGDGENVSGSGIKGKVVIIEGYILDDAYGSAMAVKNEMLKHLKAGRKGMLTAYGVVIDANNAPVRTLFALDCVIKDAPDISQEQHSKFSFSVYAPYPYWRLYTNKFYTKFSNGVAKEIENRSHFPVSYKIHVLTRGTTTQIRMDYHGLVMKLDFDPALPASSDVTFDRRENGRVYVEVDGVERNEAINIEESTLWRLPPTSYFLDSDNEFTLTISGTNVAGYTAGLYYYEYFNGIMAWQWQFTPPNANVLEVLPITVESVGDVVNE